MKKGQFKAIVQKIKVSILILLLIIFVVIIYFYKTDLQPGEDFEEDLEEDNMPPLGAIPPLLEIAPLKLNKYFKCEVVNYG